MTDVKPNVELRPNSEEREKQQQDKQNQSTVEWAKEKANEQYEAWLPWIEDTFLKYFTKDNKASYVAKEQLDKTKVTGVKQVDQLQDGVHNLAAGQIGQGGILQPVGDFVSKEGVNRAEEQQQGSKNSRIPNIPVVSGLGLGL